MSCPYPEHSVGLGSEEDILARIDHYFPREHRGILLERGDDCAELLLDSPLLALSTDIFLEGVHFRRDYFTPEEIGHKALAVNLSDLAAAGAKPLGFALNLMLPPDLPPADLNGLLSGMSALARAHDLPLCGGDLSKAPQLGLAITIWGGPENPLGEPNGVESVGKSAGVSGAGKNFLRRGQAKEGDIIFLIGEIGLARAALLSLERLHAENQQATNTHPELMSKKEELAESLPTCLRSHLKPEPQIRAGLILSAFKRKYHDCNLGLMDLSDGIIRDLPRLLGKGLGATLRLSRKDLHPELPLWDVFYKSGQSDLDSPDLIEQACIGGEDYALLGTCPISHWPRLLTAFSQANTHAQAQTSATQELNPAETKLKEIGLVTSGRGITLNGRPVSAAGFDHFAAPTSRCCGH